MEQLQIAIPKNVENPQLPDPILITYYKNLENRVLWLDSDVDEYWLEFARKIVEWNREDKNIPLEDRKPIKLMFFTRGGSLDVNNAIKVKRRYVMPNINKANRQVCDVDIQVLLNEKPFLFFDTANTTTIKDPTFDMAKGAKKIAFSNPKKLK